MTVETLSGTKGTRRPGRLANWGMATFLLLALPLVAGDYVRYLAFTFCVVAISAQAWNLLAGYCGMLSIGSQLSIGIGGYAVALLTYYGGFSVWVALPLAGLSSAGMAAILALPIEGVPRRYRHALTILFVLLWISYEIGISLHPALDVFGSAYSRRLMIGLAIFLWELPLLRLDGAYFSVATWLVAAAVESVMVGWRTAGGGAGMRVVTSADLSQLYVVACAILVLSTTGLALVLRGRYGPALTAIRDDAEAAAAVGIDIHRIRAAAFVVAGLMMGLGGALYFINATVVTPDAGFTISWSAIVIFSVVIGGIGTVSGPIVGAAFYVLVDRVVGQHFGFGLLILGLASIASVLLMPRGVVGFLDRGRHLTRRGERG